MYVYIEIKIIIVIHVTYPGTGEEEGLSTDLGLLRDEEVPPTPPVYRASKEGSKSTNLS